MAPVERRCIDCRTTVMFPTPPSEVECANCGLRMCLTVKGGIGRVIGPDWTPKP